VRKQWLIWQNWGWACEQIVALDVVTAEGELIRVDANQNSDFLWAAKGAGPGKQYRMTVDVQHY